MGQIASTGFRPPTSLDRFGPARMAGPELTRERLLLPLRGRFTHRLTVVSAGAGFGKSALLAQMCSDGLLRPAGIDMVVRCGPDDRILSVFANALRAAIGLDAPPSSVVEEEARVLAGSLAARSPVPVCLVLDDVHELGAAGPSADLLAAIYERLPSNAHLAVFGRTRPSLPVAREIARGDAILLDDAALAFTDEEWRRFSGGAVTGDGPDGAPGASSPVPIPWPALAALQVLCGDPSLGEAFVWDEVLNAMAPAARRLLALVCVVGGADAELCRGLLAVGEGAVDPVDADPDDVDPARLFADIPLVRRDGDGWFPHDLWSDHLQRELTAAERVAALQVAADHHRRRGDLIAAFRLARAAGDRAGQGAAMRDACRRIPSLVGRDALVAWQGMAAAAIEVGDTSAGGAPVPSPLDDADRHFLDGKLLADTSDLSAAVARLQEARAAYEAAGDLDGERNAILELARIALTNGDLAAVMPVYGRIVALADAGSREAQTLVRFGTAVFCELGGDRDAMPAAYGAIDAEPGTWLADIAHYNHCRVLLMAGRLAEASDALHRIGHDESARRLADDLEFCLAMVGGDVERARRAMPAVARNASELGFRRRVISSIQKAGILTVFEGARIATDHPVLAGALGFVPDEAERAPVVVLAAAERGDDALATALAGSASAGWMQGTNQTLDLPVRVVATVLASDPDAVVRDALAVRDAFAAVPALVESLRRFRTDGTMSSALRVWPAPSVVRATFVPRWATHLAVIAHGAGFPTEAAGLLATLPPVVADHLAELATHPSKRVAACARALESQLVVPPKAPIRIQLLGRCAVFHGTVESTDVSLRRARVRHLIGFLALHGPAPRAKVAAELWPDLAESDAANNLRVTLSYLLGVLEPDRRRTSRSFAIAQSDGLLAIADGPLLEVDVALLDRARRTALGAERHGDVEVALREHQKVVDLFTGDFLPDAAFEEWSLLGRDRLRHAAVGSGVRAAELLLARGEADAAELQAQWAIRLDPEAEAAHRVVVAAHLLRGENAAARVAYAGLLRATHVLGVQPEPASVMLAMRLDLVSSGTR